MVATQIFLEFSPRKFKIGEDSPNLTCAYFSDGWFNHQPACVHIHIHTNIPWVRPNSFSIPVTTRIITCLIGDPNLNLHEPLLITGREPHPTYIYIYICIYIYIYNAYIHITFYIQPPREKKKRQLSKSAMITADSKSSHFCPSRS